MNILFAFVVISLLTLAYSCSNNDNPVTSAWDNNSINGTITFVDSNGYITDTTGGYYNVDAFGTWPPNAGPSAYSLVNIKKTGNVYTASYKLSNLASGSYVITFAWNKVPYVPGNSTYLLGVYGCSTDSTRYTCWSSPNVSKAVITDSKGIGNINFSSYLDTAKKIVKF